MIMKLKSIYDKMEMLQRFLENRLEHLAAATMLIMMFSITLNATLRYLFNEPLSGIITFTELYLIVGAIFPYFAVLQREDGNVSVIVLERRFSETTNNIITFSYLIVMAGIFAYLANAFIQNALELTIKGAVLPGLGYPTYVSWWIAGVGILLLVTRILLEIIEVSWTFRHSGSRQTFDQKDDSEDWDQEDGTDD